MATRREPTGGDLQAVLDRLDRAWRAAGAPQAGARAAGLDPTGLRPVLHDWCERPPGDLVQLYGWADGLTGEAELLPGQRFPSVAQAASERRRMMQLAADLCAAEPALVWNETWWPLLTGESGCHALPCDPSGRETQPLLFKDREDEARPAFDSVASLVATATECFETGAFQVSRSGAVVEADPVRAGQAYRRHNPGAAAVAERARKESKVVAELLEALAGTDAKARERAATTLLRRRDRIAVPGLARLLAAGDGMVRRLAATVLAEIRDPRAVPALLVGLRDADAQTRCHAAMALGAIGDGRAVAPLVEALQAGGPEDSAAFARALGALNAAGAIDTLLARLGTAHVPTRLAVAGALASMSGERIVAIQRQLLADAEPQVRVAAASGLGRPGNGEAVGLLVACLDDPAWPVRVAAVGALRAIGDGAAAEPIRQALGRVEPADDPLLRSRQQMFRAAAEAALRELGPKQA